MFRLFSWFVYFQILLVTVIAKEQTDAQIEAKLEAAAIKRIDNPDSSSRKSSQNLRHHLPKGDVFQELKSELQPLVCGGTLSVAREGYFHFPLDSQVDCNIHFVGSKFENCTVAILCNGVIKLASPSPGQTSCDREYLTLSDGTSGIKTGCGTFTLDGSPRIPRNGGSDIFLKYKGSSGSNCLAFCVEDLVKGAHPKIRQVKTLSKKSAYKFEESSSCTCGKRNDVGRVVGGKSALKFEFPWIGGVTLSRKYFQRRPFCGGSLINNKYFISAAHCFEDFDFDEIQVVLHAHIMDRQPAEISPEEAKSIQGWDLAPVTDADEGSFRTDVEEIITHPLYKTGKWDYDIAILKLKTPLDFSQLAGISPICIPKIDETLIFRKGDQMTVAGWGRLGERSKNHARILQKLDVEFQMWQDCDNTDPATKRHICAGYYTGNHDSCSGDSGGPLVYQLNKNSKQYLLSGVVSAGVGCARPNHLGLYTNVHELVQWIYKHTVADSVWCKR